MEQLARRDSLDKPSRGCKLAATVKLTKTMKIETDDNTLWLALWLAMILGTVLIIITGITCIAYYNCLPIRNGYNEVQESGSQSTMWVKPTK